MVQSNPPFGFKSNNFDVLRFALAGIVFLVHSYALTGLPALAFFSDFLSSEMAVKAFFVVSGFLIFMSYEKSGGLKDYFFKRLRRIYPGYLTVIVLCMAFGFLFSTADFWGYFSLDLLKYFLSNAVFLNFMHPTLPGLFMHNNLSAVNGALWTLKIEVLFYLSVPIINFFCTRWGRPIVFAALYILSIFYTFAMHSIAVRTGVDVYLELERQLPGQLCFFIVGAGVYYYFDAFLKYATYLVLVSLVLFVLQSRLPWFAIQPIALGAIVLYFAAVIPWLGNFSKYGDFSYGIYILHFPILQCAISVGLFQYSPWVGLLVTGALVLASAVILWHGVEKRYLRKTSHYLASGVA